MVRDLRAHKVDVAYWRDRWRWRYEWQTEVAQVHNPTASPSHGTAWTRWGAQRKVGREVGFFLVRIAEEQGRDTFQMMLDIPD